MSDLPRRNAFTALAMLPFLGSILAPTRSATAQTAQAPSSSTLVVYFSRTGNTRVIANQIRRAQAADLFEIAPQSPYPEDYEETVRQAQRERDAGFEPPLQANVAGIASYRTIFLGFPIWGATAPSVIRSFLSSHNLSGKTLLPFVTHGGYGLGDSLSVIREHARDARLIDGFSIEADQERRTLEQVSAWLTGLPP